MLRSLRSKWSPVHKLLLVSMALNVFLLWMTLRSSGGDGESDARASTPRPADRAVSARSGAQAQDLATEMRPSATESSPESSTVAPPPIAAADHPAGAEWFDGEPRVIRAALSHSIPRTLSPLAGEYGDALSAAYARLFMWDLDLRRDLQPNDGMAVVYRDDPVEQVVIGAAIYDAAGRGRRLTAYRFQATGDAYPSYWREDGTEVSLRLNHGPLDQYDQITSLLRDRPDHHGLDFRTPVGTPVSSPWAGRVTRVNWNWRYNGNAIEIAYEDGLLAKFLHLSENRVEAGDHVSAGQLIALTGNTGRTTGPHLHYQLNRGDRVLDPLDVHGTHRRTLREADRGAFQAEVARFRAMLEGPAATN